MLGVTGVLALDALALPLQLRCAETAVALISAAELLRLRAEQRDADAKQARRRRMHPGGPWFDALGICASPRPAQDAPARSVYASWAMSGAAAWLLMGGWWWSHTPLAPAAQDELRSHELRAGRLAMCGHRLHCMRPAHILNAALGACCASGWRLRDASWRRR